MCSHDPFFGTNKNRNLRNGSCEQALTVQAGTKLKGKISKNEIESCYTIPIDYELSALSMSDYKSLSNSPEYIIAFLMKHSAAFVKITKARRNLHETPC